MFEDQHLMAEENSTLFRKLDEKKIANQELKEISKGGGASRCNHWGIVIKIKEWKFIKYYLFNNHLSWKQKTN